MKERGLLRSTIAALAGENIRPVFAEREAKKEMRLYESHFKSPTVNRLYNDTINRAVVHRMFPYANAIHHIQELDSASLYEWRHSQYWDRQPDEVKAVFEIALTIARAEMKRKSRRGVILAVGGGEGDMILQEDAVYAARDWNDFGASNPDTTVVTDLYKLLGLEEKIKEIPSIPEFNRFVHNDIIRVHVLNDYGVNLRFNFSGSSAGEFENVDKKIPFYPAHIGMTAQAKRTTVK